jgi:hypothetical protein
MFISGSINSVLSLLTFKNKELRKVGCGMYLLASSITSLITISIFTVKFWFVLLTQMNVSTSLSVLRGGCVSIEPVLKLFVYLDSWLNACVAIERAVNVAQGVNFNKKKSKRIARWIIIILPFCIMGTMIHEPLYRELFVYNLQKVNKDENKIVEIETSINETTGNETARNETDGNETARKETARNETARNDTARNETDGNETARKETARNETARNDTARNETAANDTENFVWCMARYSRTVQDYNTAILFFHLVAPFVVNLFSALFIIFGSARQKSATRTKQSYGEHILEQLSEHRQLMISPIILLVLSLPRLIISMLSGCVKASRNPWLYLLGYFISLTSSMLIFFIFVLPSKLYRQTFKKSLTSWLGRTRQ